MMTRHELEILHKVLDAESQNDYEQLRSKTVTFEINIIDSHIAALDEIDRLTAELAVVQEENKNLHTSIKERESTISERNSMINKLKAELAELKTTADHLAALSVYWRNESDKLTAELVAIKGIKGEPIQNYDTVTHTKPQGNTTGNLLIPRKEVQTAKSNIIYQKVTQKCRACKGTGMITEEGS